LRRGLCGSAKQQCCDNDPLQWLHVHSH
jgi:hypothetical protein